MLVSLRIAYDRMKTFGGQPDEAASDKASDKSAQPVISRVSARQQDMSTLVTARQATGKRMMGTGSYPQADDAALGARLRAGDAAAFTILYERYAPTIYDFVRRTVREPAAAEDVTQIVFTRAWERAASLRDPAKVRSWLFSLAHNAAIDRVREERPTADITEQTQLAYFAATPLREVEAQEAGALVWAAAASLEPRQYAVLDLAVRRDLSSAEIAGVLGVKDRHAAVLVTRAKDALANAVRFLLVARRRDHCPGLSALVPSGVRTLTPEQRTSVDHHMRRCPACQAMALRLVAPAELFGALLPVTLPAALDGGTSSAGAVGAGVGWTAQHPAAFGQAAAHPGALHAGAATSPSPVSGMTGHAGASIHGSLIHRIGHQILQHKIMLGASTVVVGAVAAGTLYVVPALVYSPENAAVAYIDAFDRGDALTAWSDMTVAGAEPPVSSRSSGPASPTQTSAPASAPEVLLSEESLRAMLSQPANRHARRGVHVVASQWRDGAHTVKDVTVAYDEDNQSHQQTLLLVENSSSHNLGIYPAWKVSITPESVAITVPQGGGMLAVDGLDTGAAGGSLTSEAPQVVNVLVLSNGVHTVTMAPNGLFAADTEAVGAGQTEVTMRLRLDPARAQQAITSAAATVSGCAQTGVSTPDGCPQSGWIITGGGALQGQKGDWALVGDPTTDASASLVMPIDPSRPAVTVIGRYQMLFSYLAASGDERYFSGGTYKATLDWTGQGFDLSSIYSVPASSAVPFSRQAAATDAAVLQAVTDGFTACAARAAQTDEGGALASCPTLIGEPYTPPQNVVWNLNGSQGDGAHVLFEPADGSFYVTGRMNLQVSWTVPPQFADPFNGPQTKTVTSGYAATVIWDGTKLAVVAIRNT